MIFGLVLKLEISYRVMISWKDFGMFQRIFKKRLCIFLHSEILEFPYFFFCLKILVVVNGNATM
jgi:hypothetical protein